MQLCITDVRHGQPGLHSLADQNRSKQKSSFSPVQTIPPTNRSLNTKAIITKPDSRLAIGAEMIFFLPTYCSNAAYENSVSSGHER